MREQIGGAIDQRPYKQELVHNNLCLVLGLVVESDRFVAAASGNLLLRAKLLDVTEFDVVAEKQLVDKHFTGDVLDLAAAEIVGMGQRHGIGLDKVGEETAPDEGLGFDAGLVELHLI